MAEPMLEIVGVTAGYGRTMVLFDVDVSIPVGGGGGRSWATTAPARPRCCGSRSD